MSDNFGFDEVMGRLNKLKEEFERSSIQLLEETGDLAVAETQLRTPVDSGTLIRSFTRSDVEQSGDTMEIEAGTSIEYAELVEDGHRTRNGGFVKGHHMLKNGSTIAEKHLQSRTKQVFKDIVKDFEL